MWGEHLEVQEVHPREVQEVHLREVQEMLLKEVQEVGKSSRGARWC